MIPMNTCHAFMKGIGHEVEETSYCPHLKITYKFIKTCLISKLRRKKQK